MTFNLFGRGASLGQGVARIAAAFAGGVVFGLRPTREGNTIVVAQKKSFLPGREVLAERAEAVEARWHLPARKWLRMIRPLPSIDREPLHEAD